MCVCIKTLTLRTIIMFVKFKYRIKMHYNNNNRGRNCHTVLNPHNIRKLIKITIYILLCVYCNL